MEVLTTTKLDSPDLCIAKTEIIDVEFARQLMQLNISKEEKDKIRRILKECKQGNKLDIVYKLGKNCKHEMLGRFCSLKGLGLQNLQKDIRAALSQDYYWDIDMVNAQPTLLKQYCEQNGYDCTYLKRYIDNREELLSEICDVLSIERWEAKERVVSIIFGASSSGMPSWFNHFSDEIRKIQRCIWDKNYDKLKWVRNQPNHLGKGMAYILQTCERDCLMAMDRSLSKHGRSLDVLMHDGGLVRKKDESDFPKGLLAELEKDVKLETGFDIKLIVKPIKTSFVKQEIEEEIVDDAFAARKFAELCGSRIVYDSGIVWVFDEYTGIWSCEESHIQRVITNCGDKLIFKQADKISNYSGVVKNTKNLMIKLPDILPKNDGFMLSKSKSDIGKLLFTNGIYDFSTGFTPGFNSEIVFKASMPRAFPTKDQEKVDFIREISFTDAFSDDGNREVLLHNLMRASIGDFRKKLCVGLGFTNSGKGMLTQLVRNSFGTYCSTFNGNSLIGSYDGGESSRKNGWVSDISNSRFAFSSEIQVDEKNNISIDGNLLKSLASGGDELKVRKLYQNDQTIINKSTLFIFANDMPKISPVDDAVRDRVQVVNWSFSYVQEPKRNHEKKCNPELSGLYSQIEYGDAFFWLMVEEYEKWKLDGFKEPEVPECVLQGRDDILPIIDIEEVLKQKYELTKNPEDSIQTTFIFDWLKENGVKDSITKIGRELNALGLGQKIIKKDRKTIRTRTGIRELE